MDSGDSTARDALAGFTAFPLWMWRNEVTVELVEWLKAHNSRMQARQGQGELVSQVHFMGMDLYSMFESARIVQEFLEMVDPEGSAPCIDYCLIWTCIHRITTGR